MFSIKNGRCDIKPSHRLYGEHYDKEFVQLHSVLFKRQKLWAEMYLLDLLTVPSEDRDWSHIREVLDAIAWNEKKYLEAYERINDDTH